MQGVALGGVAASCGVWCGRAYANTTQQVLSGNEFDLNIGQMPVYFTGRKRIATFVNGQLPAPLLRWREGETVTLRVRNSLATTGSIHWHGIVPADMDGVPGLSYMGIAPGAA